MEIKYKGKVFRAIVATPACGKSYICDRFSNFVDVDELRLFSKYFIPNEITRDELEKTKSIRPYKRRDDFKKRFNESIVAAIKSDKILLCAPHPEVKEILINNNIPYIFVYPAKSMKSEIKNRMEIRGNDPLVVKQNDDAFYDYYQSNKDEPYAKFKCELKPGQYLYDLLKDEMGIDFNQCDKKEIKK